MLRFKITSSKSTIIDTVYVSYLDIGVTKFVPLTKCKTPKNESYFSSTNLAFIASSPTDFTLFVNNEKEGVLSIYEKTEHRDCCTFSKLDKLQFDNQSILTTLDVDYCYKINLND